MAVVRKEAKGKSKVTREKPVRVGCVAEQGTLQHGNRTEATNICTPSMTTTVKTSKNQLTTKKICKHGVCWKKVKNEQLQEVISRRDTQRAKKANQASLLSVENSQGQLGESRSHRGLWSRGSCDA